MFHMRLSGTHKQARQEHFQQGPDESACVSIRCALTTSCRAAAQQAFGYKVFCVKHVSRPCWATFRLQPWVHTGLQTMVALTAGQAALIWAACDSSAATQATLLPPATPVCV